MRIAIRDPAEAAAAEHYGDGYDGGEQQQDDERVHLSVEESSALDDHIIDSM